MAALTVRNLSGDVHRALRLRAAEHAAAQKQKSETPLPRLFAQTHALCWVRPWRRWVDDLSDQDVDAINRARDKTPAEPMRFE
ncbi:FitA-like ribbon-helix-helix domain-containing protein [Pseudomonas typographi]|uniref:FitA-like ribbon-helix-helix domain-containing protein n=1 Tax=Pseudomonas typographi TaxID=2715964 RepID=UPI003B8A9464